MPEIETMEEMITRLGGSGAAAQAKAVAKSIELINKAPGMLDSENRQTALYHLAVALSGSAHADTTVINLADYLNQINEE